MEFPLQTPLGVPVLSPSVSDGHHWSQRGQIPCVLGRCSKLRIVFRLVQLYYRNAIRRPPTTSLLIYASEAAPGGRRGG